jgi:hypothetical protein
VYSSSIPEASLVWFDSFDAASLESVKDTSYSGPTRLMESETFMFVYNKRGLDLEVDIQETFGLTESSYSQATY